MVSGKHFVSKGIDLVCVLLVFSGLIIQFGLQVFWGEDPVSSNFDELGLYIAISLAVSFGATMFLRYRKGFISKSLTVFFAFLILLLWLIQAADMIFYTRPVYLVLVRSLGLFTTALVIAYGVFRIYQDRKGLEA